MPKLSHHRGVIERTVSWALRFKRLGLRYNRTASTLLLLAVMLINLRRLRRQRRYGTRSNHQPGDPPQSLITETFSAQFRGAEATMQFAYARCDLHPHRRKINLRITGWDAATNLAQHRWIIINTYNKVLRSKRPESIHNHTAVRRPLLLPLSAILNKLCRLHRVIELRNQDHKSNKTHKSPPRKNDRMGSSKPPPPSEIAINVLQDIEIGKSIP